MNPLSKLSPLGVFGDEMFAPLEAKHLKPLVGKLESDLRVKVAHYLRSGTIVFAIMEHTKDVIDGRFGVPGGSGIATDGSYYWRQDCAEYVETYGVEIDSKAVAAMQERKWVAPAVAKAKLLEIDQWLYEVSRGRKSEGY